MDVGDGGIRGDQGERWTLPAFEMRSVHPVLSFSPWPNRTAKKLPACLPACPVPSSRPERRTPGCRIGQPGGACATAAARGPAGRASRLRPTLSANPPRRFRLGAGEWRGLFGIRTGSSSSWAHQVSEHAPSVKACMARGISLTPSARYYILYILNKPRSTDRWMEVMAKQRRWNGCLDPRTDGRMDRSFRSVSPAAN